MPERYTRSVPDDPDPPRKFYQLKPTAFERLNPGPSSGGAEPMPANSVEPATNGPIDVRDLARQAAGKGPLPGTHPPANRPNDVHQMLRENLAQANNAGLNEVAPRPRQPSRRKRDYWLLVVTVNLFFLFWAIGPFSNPISMIYGFSGSILFTCGFTWVMFGVMDDY